MAAPAIAGAQPPRQQELFVPQSEAANAMLQLLQAPPPARRQRAPPPPDLPRLDAQLNATLRGLWASSTWAQRQSLWRRLAAFCAASQLPLNDRSAALFILSLGVTAQTQHGYASTLSALFGRLGLPNGLLSLMAAALRAQGALIPLHQARPMQREQLEQLLPTLGRRDAVAMALAWKTASRWSDIQRLIGRQVLLATPEEIIIDFSDRTKTSRSRPFAPQLLVVVRGRWTAAIAEVLSRLLPQEPLTQLTTADVEELLRPLGLTAHSIKRGALNLVAAAAEEGRVDPSVLPLLARHKTDSPLVQASVIRYVSNKPALARVLGTQHATALL